MSIFDFPRINFSGTTWFNPGTANNDSLGPGEELTYTSDTERVQPVSPKGMSDAQIIAWLQSTHVEPGLGEVLNSQWNYYGDMSFRFLDARVTSVELAYGKLLTRPEDEPLVGAVVYPSRGILCDNNPEGFDTTQFFMESLEIRAPGVLGPTGTFVSRKPTRACTIRGLNWDRNVSFHAGVPNTSGGAGGASGTFQSVIEVRPDDLTPVPESLGVDYDVTLHKLLQGERSSPGLAALLSLFHGARPPRGLVFRFNFYLTYPRISDPDLSRDFKRGVFTENPAIGCAVGSIAPWYGEEPKSAAMGRFLGKAGDFVNPYTTSRRYELSGIVGRVDPTAKRVALDAIDTFPEDGPDGKKFDLGAVQLGIRKATPPGGDPTRNASPVHLLGEIRNDKETYVAQGGVYSVPYGHLGAELAAAIEETGAHEHELVIQTSRFGVLLYEQEFMVAPSSKCNYLDQAPPGEAWTEARLASELSLLPEPLRGALTLSVYRKGEPFRGQVATTIEQWRITPTGSADPAEAGVYVYPERVGLETREITDGSVFHLVPLGDGAGVRMWRFLPFGHWPGALPPEQLVWSLTDEFFATLRVLPYDDYRGISDDALDFERVYREVLRNYYLLMPAMNKRLDMSDPSIWRSPTAAEYVLRATDLALWEYYDFMPRTRDLSRCRRELLRRFCEKVLRDAGQGAPGEGEARAAIQAGR